MTEFRCNRVTEFRPDDSHNVRHPSTVIPLSHHLLPQFRNPFNPDEFPFFYRCFVAGRSKIDFTCFEITTHSALRKYNGLIADAQGFAYTNPVSYTHLRAHETGRNLVCRLLLEKK